MPKNKYPNYIMQKVRQNLGLEDEYDISKDEKINKMTPDEVWKRICEWKGLLGFYHEHIKHWIQDIYHIKLNKEE
jgi:hypothetical protein